MQRFKTIPINPALCAIIVAFGIISLLITCQRFEPEQLVLVKTGAVSEVIHDGCKAEGEIYDTGKEGISQHGFCWSKAKTRILKQTRRSNWASRVQQVHSQVNWRA